MNRARLHVPSFRAATLNASSAMVGRKTVRRAKFIQLLVAYIESASRLTIVLQTLTLNAADHIRSQRLPFTASVSFEDKESNYSKKESLSKGQVVLN